MSLSLILAVIFFSSVYSIFFNALLTASWIPSTKTSRLYCLVTNKPVLSSYGKSIAPWKISCDIKYKSEFLPTSSRLNVLSPKTIPPCSSSGFFRSAVISNNFLFKSNWYVPLNSWVSPSIV